ncbi:MAG: hypothetical protein JXA77_10735 [Bacteroidales bacterium]|nr:hypothetical protein [Bacteroidales bacterium]MBN2818513.1 hypothetical protein [Bacteroidales bacterium]
MVELISVDKDEIWCKITSTGKLTKAMIYEIENLLDNNFVNQQQIFISLGKVSEINSDGVYGLREIIIKYYQSGSSVKFSSVYDNLQEIIDYLTNASDG